MADEIEEELGRPLRPNEVKFIEEVEDLGYEVEVYRGYAYRVTPATRVDGTTQLVEVIRGTTMSVGWDGIGQSGSIVYPT